MTPLSDVETALESVPVARIASTDVPVGKAWQRQVRERLAELDQEAERMGGNLYALDAWERRPQDVGIAKSRVRQITAAYASEVILRYEWLGNMPGLETACFGIEFPNEAGNWILAGAVVYRTEYAENWGVWDGYGFSTAPEVRTVQRDMFGGDDKPMPEKRKVKMWLLARGACVWWAHPHTGSKLIRDSMKLLPDHVEIVTATVDAQAGEIGTIYQACGFDFVGVLSPNTKAGIAAIINGKLETERSLRRKLYGVTSMRAVTREAVLERWPSAELQIQERKSRYFAFRGDARTKRRNRAAILDKIKPYPKRDGKALGSVAPQWVTGDRVQA